MRQFASAFTFTIALVASGCALMSKAPPVEIREFSPEQVESSPSGTPGARAPGVELRLGRVRSSANLRRNIVYRVSNVEVGQYDDWKWTENPEEYLRRGVTQALFDERGLVQAVGGRQVTLDLELTAFEEVRRGAARLGRVQVSFVLRDEKRVLESGVVTHETPATNGDIDSVIHAISDALDASTSELGDRVATRLAPADSP